MDDQTIQNLTDRVTKLEQQSFGPNPVTHPLTIANLKNYIATTSGTSVTQLIAGSNITLNPTNGKGIVTVTSTAGTTGVSSISTGAGINASSSTGAVTLTNVGVTSLTQSSGITITGGTTGDLTIAANAAVSAIPTAGTASQSTSDTNATQTIVHSLGTTPAYIRAVGVFAGGSSSSGTTVGTYNGTTNRCVYNYILPGSGSTLSAPGNTFMQIEDLSSNGQNCTATVDGTNIYLGWTKIAGGLSGNIVFLWEAYA